MVRRMFGLVYKEIRGLHQAAYVLALFAFISQILAIIRDRILAGEFGAGETLDIYYTAFRIPDVLFVLFASTLSVYVLIPFVVNTQRDFGAKTASVLLSNIALLFCVAYSLIAALLIVTASWYVPFVFPGITDVETLVTLLQILLLQPFFLGLSSLFGVITQMSHRFVLYALSPLVYNVGIIFGVVVLYPLIGIAGLAWGVVLGAVLHCAIQWPLIRKSPVHFLLPSTWLWADIRAVLAVSVPRALTLSAGQLVLLVIVSVAGVLSVGSVSVFQFAFNLQSVPLAIIGVSYSVAAFPTLAQLYASKHMDEFAKYIMTALRHIVFWSVPVIVLCIVLRAQLVRVILGSGSFDWEDTRLTAAVFAVLITALLAHGVNLLLVRAFYAGGNTRTPFLVTLAGSLLAIGAVMFATTWYTANSALAISIAKALRVSDVAGTEIIMLGMVYAFALIIQSLVLFALAVRSFSLPTHLLGTQLRDAAIASLFGGVGAYAALQFLVSGLNTETFIGIFLQGLLAGVFGLIGVILGYALMKSPELHEVAGAINRKLFKTDVVAPEQDIL